jgi:hypothetical protein
MERVNQFSGIVRVCGSILVNVAAALNRQIECKIFLLTSPSLSFFIPVFPGLLT